jgi:hypothetical protein
MEGAKRWREREGGREGKRRGLTFRCALYLTTPFLLLSQEHFLFLKVGEREGGREGRRITGDDAGEA